MDSSMPGFGGIQFPSNNLSTIPLTNQLGPWAQAVAGTGQGFLGTGMGNLDQSAQYWNSILNGDYMAMQKATAPTADLLSQAYSGASNMLNQGSPLGGYRGTQMASLPFAQASQLGNFLMNLQPTAAQNLAQIGSTQGQLGLGETQAGSSMLGTILQSLLTQRGQNIQNASGLLSGIGSILGGLGGLGAGIGGAASGVASALGSDIRIKEGIIPLGDIKGVPIYAFRYKGDPEVRIGVMAQEVYERYPNVVHVGGQDAQVDPWMVNYEALFEELGVR